MATRVKSLIDVFNEGTAQGSSEGRRAISLIEFQCVRRPGGKMASAVAQAVADLNIDVHLDN